MTVQDRLLKRYKKSFEELLKRIESKEARGVWAGYEKQLLREIQKAVKELDASASKDLEQLVKEAYIASEENALRAVSARIGRGLNRNAMQLVMENAIDTMVEANHYFGRHAQDRIRKIGLDAIAEKLSMGQTVREAQRRILETLQAEGMQIKVGTSGRTMQLDKYAELVARTTTREATNTAMTSTGEQLGYDLVKFSTHYPTCEVCALIQGRVFSISGKDKRFPALSSVPGFDKGFKTIHPHCRHVLVITVEALWTDEERAKYLEDAMKPVRDGDTRSQAEVEAYNSAQAKKREQWQDRRQYAQYQTKLGEAAPKTFASFRSIKTANGKAWGILEAQNRGMVYYDRAVKNEPEITAAVKDIAGQVGMEPSGLEFRIKSKESYLRKIKSNYSPDGNEYEIKDILRYTYTAPPGALADKTMQSLDTFKKMGYTVDEVKNTWLAKNAAYRGINTVITAPGGQKFELQFHTPESFDLKDGELHQLYEKARVMDPDSEEYISLQKQMRNLSGKLTVPPGIERVKK